MITFTGGETIVASLPLPEESSASAPPASSKRSPVSVTATCVHVLVGSCPERLSCCSPPLPLVVIANRGPLPALTARNMYVPVPVPKSKIRDQVVVATGLTHAETVKSPLRLLAIPGGRST